MVRVGSLPKALERKESGDEYIRQLLDDRHADSFESLPSPVELDRHQIANNQKETESRKRVGAEAAPASPLVETPKSIRKLVSSEGSFVSTTSRSRHGSPKHPARHHPETPPSLLEQHLHSSFAEGLSASRISLIHEEKTVRTRTHSPSGGMNRAPSNNREDMPQHRNHQSSSSGSSQSGLMPGRNSNLGVLSSVNGNMNKQMSQKSNSPASKAKATAQAPSSHSTRRKAKEAHLKRNLSLNKQFSFGKKKPSAKASSEKSIDQMLEETTLASALLPVATITRAAAGESSYSFLQFSIGSQNFSDVEEGSPGQGEEIDVPPLEALATPPLAPSETTCSDVVSSKEKTLLPVRFQTAIDTVREPRKATRPPSPTGAALGGAEFLMSKVSRESQELKTPSSRSPKAEPGRLHTVKKHGSKMVSSEELAARRSPVSTAETDGTHKSVLAKHQKETNLTRLKSLSNPPGEHADGTSPDLQRSLISSGSKPRIKKAARRHSAGTEQLVSMTESRASEQKARVLSTSTSSFSKDTWSSLRGIEKYKSPRSKSITKSPNSQGSTKKGTLSTMKAMMKPLGSAYEASAMKVSPQQAEEERKGSRRERSSRNELQRYGEIMDSSGAKAPMTPPRRERSTPTLDEMFQKCKPSIEQEVLNALGYDNLEAFLESNSSAIPKENRTAPQCTDPREGRSEGTYKVVTKALDEGDQCDNSKKTNDSSSLPPQLLDVRRQRLAKNAKRLGKTGEDSVCNDSNGWHRDERRTPSRDRVVRRSLTEGSSDDNEESLLPISGQTYRRSSTGTLSSTDGEEDSNHLTMDRRKKFSAHSLTRVGSCLDGDSASEPQSSTENQNGKTNAVAAKLKSELAKSRSRLDKTRVEVSHLKAEVEELKRRLESLRNRHASEK